MDDERLEWALRRVPGVLACSLEGDTATLLVDPHASALDVEAAANALLLEAGDPRPPLVMGGTRPIVAGRRRFDVVPLAKAAGPGVVAVGAAALVVSLVASPAAFWRDATPPPAQGSSQAIAPPPVAGPDPAPTIEVHGAEPATPEASTPAPAPSRRLVLLVPELPQAPGLTAAPATPAVQVGELALGAPVPSEPASAPAKPVESPLPAGVHSAESISTASPRHRERAGRPRPVTAPRNLADAVERNDARDATPAVAAAAAAAADGLDLAVRLRPSAASAGSR